MSNIKKPSPSTNCFRLALGIEYNGQSFYGWQAQQGLRTVQATICLGIKKLLGEQKQSGALFTLEPNDVVASGRTDRGVHAKEQVIHVDIPCEYINRSEQSWVRGLNRFLPNDIRVLWYRHESETFDARRSATGRQYRYFLQTSTTKPAILGGLVGWYWQSLDISLMQKAAQHLIGSLDFSSFRSSECQAISPIREMRKINIYQSEQNSQVIIFDFYANAFLHHMIRNIVGALIVVGNGKQSPAWINKILQAKNRSESAATFMADGLYLWKIGY